MILTDGQKDVLAELNADARYTEHALSELADECDTFSEMLSEIGDADLYTPNEWHDFGEWEAVEGDGEVIPW